MQKDQDDLTKTFVESVKLLIRNGDVKTQKEIADRIGLHVNSMHLILKGERNVPPVRFRHFMEVYRNLLQKDSTLVEEVDYRDRYIALLEKNLEEMEDEKKALETGLNEIRSILTNINLGKLAQDTAIAKAYAKALWLVVIQHRQALENKPPHEIVEDMDRILASELEELS